MLLTSLHAVPLHGIASRHDLPLPFPYVVAGASAALLVSFAVLFLAWRRPRYAGVLGRPLPRLSRAVGAAPVRIGARLVVLALYLVIALALVAGPDRLDNPVFGFVFVWMWVALVPLSLLAGPVWRATNPLRTVHRGLCALARVNPADGLLRLPARVGVWPAALGLVAFAWLELVQPERTSLAVLRLWAVAWLVILILGAVVCGNRWIAAADPFETYASTVAQLSPLHGGLPDVGLLDGDPPEDRAPEPSDHATLRLVNPLAGLAGWTPPFGAVAVVAALLGSTAFDSFTNTSWWISTVQASTASPILWATAGLLALVLVVAVTFSAAAMWMARYGADPRPAVAYPRLMVGSVVPIVVGYAIAHYATLLVVEGQRVLVNLSDPLGRGWNLLGTADWGIGVDVYNHPTAVALVQLAAIVLGHVLGIVVAHELALTLLRPGAVLAGQWPMLAVMVFYTCSGLLLLFSP